MGATVTSLEDEIRQLATRMGASHFGIANMTRAFDVSPGSFEECGKLLTGISIGVGKDDWLVDGLPQTDNRYRTDHYNTKIALALRIGDAICAKLAAAGHRAHRLSHPPKIKPTGLYKLIGHWAGVGWIGKNHLLITPDRGARVALAAVLTDAPLPPSAKKPTEDRCGDCTRCIDICPVKAFQDLPLDETNPLRSFDVGKCSTNRGVINPTGWGGCGLCVKACPYGQTTRERDGQERHEEAAPRS
jgi:epoxyqueuosine reductase